MLKEVVLLDDSSDHRACFWRQFEFLAELGQPLDDYIVRFDGLVKLFRRTTRQGLIRARIEGAKEATGSLFSVRCKPFHERVVHQRDEI